VRLQILRIIQEESLKDNTASVLCQVPVDVASFLLNEKRTEIAKIELKQRINVLMVPNKSLETPNYKLSRLKHDDPRLDNIDRHLQAGRRGRGRDLGHPPRAGADQPPDPGDQGCVARRARAGGTGQARTGGSPRSVAPPWRPRQPS
jgi:hypothetical protein